MKSGMRKTSHFAISLSGAFFLLTIALMRCQFSTKVEIGDFGMAWDFGMACPFGVVTFPGASVKYKKRTFELRFIA